MSIIYYLKFFTCVKVSLKKRKMLNNDDYLQINKLEGENSGYEQVVYQPKVDVNESAHTVNEMRKNNAENKPAQIIKDWFLSSRSQTYADLNRLLTSLREIHPELPKSDEGLLPTSKDVNKYFNVTEFDSESKFSYFGIQWQLERIVNPDLHEEKKIFLKINIDGLPLYRSSDIEFWPILGQVYYRPAVYSPFTIALYCGKGKPSNITKFFDDFINEVNYLKENKILIDGKEMEVCVLCYICDNPARSFIKCVKGHTAFYGCERCIAKAVSFKSRRVYPSIQYQKRSNHSFLHKLYPEHHLAENTPLTQIKSIDMVHDFLLDSLHLLFLGVMKKLLKTYWLEPGYSTKLSKADIKKVCERLKYLSNKIPAEFQRATRRLDDIGKWKATEFRMFLLYIFLYIVYNFINIFFFYFITYILFKKILIIIINK